MINLSEVGLVFICLTDKLIAMVFESGVNEIE